MTDISKIPSYILNNARKNVPMIKGSFHEFSDEQLSKMTKREIFDHYLEWNGIIGFSSSILDVIEELFKVELKD
jgi:hypothetical protein